MVFVNYDNFKYIILPFIRACTSTKVGALDANCHSWPIMGPIGSDKLKNSNFFCAIYLYNF